jgi:hypothetical protein
MNERMNDMYKYFFKYYIYYFKYYFAEQGRERGKGGRGAEPLPSDDACARVCLVLSVWVTVSLLHVSQWYFSLNICIHASHLISIRASNRHKQL